MAELAEAMDQAACPVESPPSGIFNRERSWRNCLTSHRSKWELYAILRLARLDTHGALYHVMGRGIEVSTGTTSLCLSTLAEDGSMDNYAWALPSNHFHLLCKTKNQPLSSSMHKLLTGYVVNFNKRHKRLGYLFQHRYKSIVCQKDVYLMELTFHSSECDTSGIGKE